MKKKISRKGTRIFVSENMRKNKNQIIGIDFSDENSELTISVFQVPWGFSLSWGRPPRVERVDTGSPAERSGLRPGDHVVFVDTSNVVTLPREDILSLIQSATNQLVLEVYRKGAASQSSIQRPSIVNVTLQSAIEHPPNGQTSAVAFTAEVGTGVLV